MLEAFCDWLSQTPPSVFIQERVWIVATTQSIHIAAIAVIACAVVAIDLRLVGVTKRGPSLAALERRFTPWIWPAAVVLLATGLLLVLGEPQRELLNWLFWTKMALVAAVLAVTFLFQSKVRGDASAWDASPPRKAAARVMGALSILLIVAIIIAGRWIAYVVV